MARNSTEEGRRDTYRHGDLRNALITAGLDLARTGGPDAVVLREVTRRTGVTPNAAYRHFTDRSALLTAVCSAAQAELARAIDAAQAAVSPSLEPALQARARFQAVGLGYLQFARQQPGVFRAAFWLSGNLERATSAERRGSGGLTPFQLLETALDALVETGGLAPERRQDAELLAWSAVHGLATLLIDGPLRELSEEHALRLERQLVLMVERGL